MNKWILYAMSSALVASPLVVGTGCNQSVTPDDVADARQNVAEERRETQEAQRDADRAIREEQQETEEAVRHQVMRPITEPEGAEAVREEERETREVRDDAMNRVREEQKETREAEQKADEMETKLQAQRDRDRYVDDVKATLEQAERRIEKLEEQKGDTENEDAKKRLDDRISEIKMDRDKVQEELDRLESAELLEWETKRDDVQNAMEQLKKEFNNSL